MAFRVLFCRLQGLDSLAQHGGGHAANVINVLFGQSQPSLLSSASDSAQHETDNSISTEEAVAAPCTLQAFNAGLNDSQRAAVAFALSTDDVALMHGPPGTGLYTLFARLCMLYMCCICYTTSFVTTGARFSKGMSYTSKHWH